MLMHIIQNHSTVCSCIVIVLAYLFIPFSRVCILLYLIDAITILLKAPIVEWAGGLGNEGRLLRQIDLRGRGRGEWFQASVMGFHSGSTIIYPPQVAHIFSYVKV